MYDSFIVSPPSLHNTINSSKRLQLMLNFIWILICNESIIALRGLIIMEIWIVHKQRGIRSSGGFIAYKKGNIGNMAASSEDHYRVSDCEAKERLYYIFPGYNTKHLHNLHLGVAQWTERFSIIHRAALCKTGCAENAFQRRVKAHYCTYRDTSSHRFSPITEEVNCWHAVSQGRCGVEERADVSYSAAQTY